jgi:hypothetical protein
MGEPAALFGIEDGVDLLQGLEDRVAEASQASERTPAA